MASNTVAGHQEGDAFAPKRTSAQEEYYQFMLYKEKLQASGTPAGEISSILGASSELERLEQKIINKLSTDSRYSQSSAEYQVLSQLTGETSYIGIGKWLAQKIYEKKRAEYLINQFAGGADIDSLKKGRGLLSAVTSAFGGSS
jgi:hypothetical protein